MPREQALYVIVRKDLSKSSAAVQAGHAAVKFAFEHGHKVSWRNGTLVYLSVPNEAQLLHLKEEVADKMFSTFEEPDLDNQMTAIAVLGDEASRVSEFSHLSLL